MTNTVVMILFSIRLGGAGHLCRKANENRGLYR